MPNEFPTLSPRSTFRPRRRGEDAADYLDAKFSAGFDLLFTRTHEIVQMIAVASAERELLDRGVLLLRAELLGDRAQGGLNPGAIGALADQVSELNNARRDWRRLFVLPLLTAVCASALTLTLTLLVK